jgi:hypothetical protein
MVRSVRAFGDSLARGRGQALAPEEGSVGLATQYLVEIERPMLAGPGTPLGRTTLLLDTTSALTSGYPKAAPSVFVVSQPLPFCHRVQIPSGVVCIGQTWSDARGRILLAHLVVHCTRWFGFDEPLNGDAGLNSAAYRYWSQELAFRALPSDVPYPVVPDSVTHGRPAATVTLANAGFRARGVTPQSTSTVFRPSGVRQ